MSRTNWVLTGVAALAAIVAGAGAIIGSTGTQAAVAAQRSPVSTATVRMGELSASVSVDGTLTYAAQPDGAPYSVVNEAHGAYTELPTVGQVIHQGEVLYRVNDSPVVLLYGSTPAYRSLSVGASGPDVTQLNADLVRLGYAKRAQLNPTSSTFGSATIVALEKLQAAAGLAPSGTLPRGQAVFEPTALRVTDLALPLGGGAQVGQMVLQGTSTRREVQVALSATQQTDVTVGDKVSITLPDNKTTAGVVSTVGTVATCPSSSASASSSSTATGTDSCSPGNSAGGTPTIDVNVTPSDPAVTGTWDQAPVQIGITTAKVRSALTVPVNALVSRSSGGYAVEVVDGRGAEHLVRVSLGLFDDAEGLVQVTGSAIAAGQKVVVPST
jgi:hypothetical protein